MRTAPAAAGSSPLASAQTQQRCAHVGTACQRGRPLCSGQLLPGPDCHPTGCRHTQYVFLGGVQELVSSRMYPLAALVFFASILVPVLKMLGLTALLLATQTGRVGWLRDRTRLYYAYAGSGAGR